MHKRSNVHVEMTRMGLEMSAHPWGLCEQEWGIHWLEALEECNQNADKDGYLMTTVGPDGTFTPGCNMETDEIAIHLLEILTQATP